MCWFVSAERLGVSKSEFDGERGRYGMGEDRFVLELHGKIGRIEGAAGRFRGQLAGLTWDE
jgi:hypothetical protein